MLPRRRRRAAARLRPFDTADGVAGAPLIAADDTLLANLPLHSNIHLVLETRAPGEVFPPAESFTLTLLVFDAETLELSPPVLHVLDFEDAAAARAYTADELVASVGGAVKGGLLTASHMGKLGAGADAVTWLDSVDGATRAGGGGLSLLVAAAAGGAVGAGEVLIGSGARVGEVVMMNDVVWEMDSSGRRWEKRAMHRKTTAMHVAVRSGKEAMVRMLMAALVEQEGEEGARVFIAEVRNSDGLTVAELATSCGLVLEEVI